MNGHHGIDSRRPGLAARLLLALPGAGLFCGLPGGPAAEPTHAQETVDTEIPATAAADDPIAVIPGIWVRDERLSENAVDKLEEAYGQTFGGGPGRSPGAAPGSGRTGSFGSGGFGRGGFGAGRGGRPPGGAADGPSTMREMARDLAEQLDVLLIRIDDPQLLIRNARREDRILYLDGRDISDGFGGRSRARILGDALEVETASRGRQKIETFFLEGDRLVLVTDLQGGRFADLSFRTVYERSGDPPAAAAAAPPARDSGAAPPPDEFDRHDFLPPVEGGRTRRPQQMDGGRSARPATIRILPPERGYRELLTGRVLIQTLTIDPQIAVVEFLVDGEPAARVTRPPFDARIELAEPPREQVVEVRATSARGARAGRDRLTLNRLDPPFAVRIVGITPGELDGEPVARVEAGVSTPRSAKLEQVEVYRTDELVAVFDAFDDKAGPSGVRTVAADVPVSDVTPQDFVRITARLAGGSEREDVRLLQGARFSDEVNVQLVRIQVLVVDRLGNPVGDLEPADFEIRENGERRPVETLRVSDDVPLSLGLAIDSSGSMEPIWRRTNAIAEAFLDSALTWRDQAFLVDFDSTLRLVQPLTGSKPLLARGLERLFPQGRTALYDAIVFSLLQYGEAPGRRALVVVTDGFDSDSRSDPTRAIDFGKRLGVPVYVVAMRSTGFGPTTMEDANLRNSMRLITGPTGGRLFQIESVEQMARVFDHIRDELRRQVVLTYYSDRPLGTAIEPDLRMTRRGLRVRSALPLDAVE